MLKMFQIIHSIFLKELCMEEIGDDRKHTLEGSVNCFNNCIVTYPKNSFQLESSVALKPFFLKLTTSELHAVMTSGFATVAGSIFAATIEFGVNILYDYIAINIK